MKTKIGILLMCTFSLLKITMQANAQCPVDPVCTQTATSGTSYLVSTGSVLCIGTNYNSGTITVAGGTVLIQSGGTLNSGANVSITSGTIQLSSGSTMNKNISPSVSATINNCGTISGAPAFSSKVTVNNYSTALTLAAGTSTVNNYASNATITYNAIDNGINFNNYGSTGVTLNVNSGNPNTTVNITNDATSSITVVTNTGNSNCATSLGSTTNITNNGTMTFPNSLCIKAGLITNTKNLTFQNQLAMNNGTVESKSGATTTINTLTKNGGSFNVYSGSTIPITTINNFSGSAITMMDAGCSYVTLATPPSVSFNSNFTANGSNTAPNGINYCGGVPKNSAAATNTIAAVANNGSGAYRITFSSSANTPLNNAYIAISGVTGGNLNGYWQVTKISATVFDLVAAPYSAVTSLTGNSVDVNNLYFGNGSYVGYSGCTNPCIPLPIKLVSFNAYKEDGAVKIVWETLEERNNQYYVIEKSTDGIHYQTVLTVDGNKNSTSLLTYTEYDFNPLAGISYYRLKQVDYNGSYSYSALSAVNFDGNLNWTLFPNPSIDGGFTIISSFSSSDIIAVTVTDITGNRIKYYSSAEYTQEMKINGLSSGLYIVSIQTVTEVYSKKLIVQ